MCLLLSTVDVSNGYTDNGADTYQIKDVLVTATRFETAERDVTAPVIVITSEDLENMPADHVAEVLRYIPGIYVEFNGGPGSDASAVRIQGSEVRQVAVFQDGVPLNQLANPMTDLSYLPVDAIDRIEIYKGAASSSWGSALGGVINIITKEPDPKKPVAMDARASYGEFATVKARGDVSGNRDRFGWFLSLTKEKSDGFTDHTAYEQQAVYAKLNYDAGTDSRLNFVYSYDQGRNDDPLPNYPDFWDDIDRQRSYQRLLFETVPAAGMVLTLEGRHHEYENLIDDVYRDHREVYNDYRDELWGTSARLKWDITASHTLIGGFDGDWGQYDWENYADQYDTGYWAAYVNDTYRRGHIVFNAGIRYDDNQDFGSEASPSGGAVYRFANFEGLVRVQVAEGFSAPPAAWVDDPEYGNPDLKAESAVSVQLGGEMRFFGFLGVELNLFYADVSDLIRFDDDAMRYENIDDAVRQGVEGMVSADLDFGLTLGLGGSYVDVRDAQTDAVIQNIPRTLCNASARFTHGSTTHCVLGRYVDHNATYPETKDRVFIFDYTLKQGLPFPKPYGKATIYGTVYNLFDTDYLYREVWPKPGRWIEAGIRFVY